MGRFKREPTDKELEAGVKMPNLTDYEINVAAALWRRYRAGEPRH